MTTKTTKKTTKKKTTKKTTKKKKRSIGFGAEYYGLDALSKLERERRRKNPQPIAIEEPAAELTRSG